MDVTLAVLADAANVSREGKLNILGIFDRLYAPTFPTTHPAMNLVIQYEAPADEFGLTRTLTLLFLDEDMQEHGRLSGRIEVGFTSDGTPFRDEWILPLGNIDFPRAGRYIWQVMIDGELKAEVSLRVEQR